MVRVGGGEGRRVLTVSLSSVMVILDWKMEWKGGGGRGTVMLEDVAHPLSLTISAVLSISISH